MAKAKTNGFRLLPSYYEAIRDLPDDSRLAMYDAIFDCGFGNEVKDLPPLLNGYFMLIKPSLEKSIKFETKQKANGGKGGRPPKPKRNPNETQNGFGLSENSETEKPNENLAIAVAVDSAIDSDIDIDNSAKPKKKKKQFVPPTLEEIKAYVAERNSPVDPVAFWEYFEAGQWKDSEGKPVLAWKQKLLTWEKHQNERRGANGNERDSKHYWDKFYNIHYDA